ncbi:MAG TPA: hypothetical protein VEA69_22970 [Tepidisphaeraceae bacterium]|nr:hypothetical protein [Tepidisphaeraceae bacterium]
MGREGLHDLYARIPVELWQRLQAHARANRRSVTQEVIWMIERHLEGTAREGSEAPRRKSPRRPKGG